MAQRIELRVGDLHGLFDERDPSPLREKDLSRSAEEFIVSAARFLPGTVFELRVQLERGMGTADARAVGDALRAHFEREAEATRRKLRRGFQLGRRSLLIGLMFLALIVMAGEFVKGRAGDSTALQLIGDSLTIGGWVALWRPLEFFLYDWWPIRQDIKLFEGLSKAPVEIV